VRIVSTATQHNWHWKTVISLINTLYANHTSEIKLFWCQKISLPYSLTADWNSYVCIFSFTIFLNFQNLFVVWWLGIRTSPLCIWPAVFFQLLWKLSPQNMVDIHVWFVVHKVAMEQNFLPLHFGFPVSITPPPTIFHPSNWVLLNISSLSPCIHACRNSYSGLRITMSFHKILQHQISWMSADRQIKRLKHAPNYAKQ